jgi:hypothetical protein
MTAPGWYNDEQDPALARWHDGADWTRHTVRKLDWAGRGTPPPPVDDAVEREVEPPRAAGGWVVAERPTTPSPQGTSPSSATPPITTPDRATPPSGPPLGAAPPARARAIRRQRMARAGGRHRLAFVGAIVVLAVIVVVVVKAVGGDDGGGALARALGDDLGAATGRQTFGEAFTTPDGSYKISIVVGDPTDDASPEGCVAKAGGDRTNLTFLVRIGNEGKERAPIPEIGVGLNLDSAGRPSLSVLRFEEAVGVPVELGTPSGDDRCKHARTAGGTGELGPGEHRDFDGVAGPVADPVPPGTALLVHHPLGDPAVSGGLTSSDLYVPFPTDTTTSTSSR